MAKQASKTVIGVFVVSSIAMLIAGVIVFGSGDIFKKELKYVMFFEDSVKGLSVGAPVIWHGVTVGTRQQHRFKGQCEETDHQCPGGHRSGPETDGD